MDANTAKMMAIGAVFAGKKFPKVIEYRDINTIKMAIGYLDMFTTMVYV